MINRERLKSRMLQMAELGKTEKGGVTRLALSKEDEQARQLFVQWMNDIGLQTRVDDFGNIYGRLEGRNPDLPAVMAGSHLDSVPKGGQFDGVLGVLGSLEAIETIKETGVAHEAPIEIVSFTNEEGARFTPQMLGSGAVTGEFTQDYVYDRQDPENHRFEDELRDIGFVGDQKNRLNDLRAFIEMHIEQGPILESEQKNIGVVEGIAGFSWMEVKVYGESNHSGSTPMDMRQDALVTSASVIKEIYQWAKARGDGTVATVGKIQTATDIINTVPGETTFTVDVRHPQETQLAQCVHELKQLIGKVVDSESLDYSVQEIKSHAPVLFSSQMVNKIESACSNQGIPYKRMKSGAGHDAMYMNKITDTAMIFVPSVNGKSHCEEEKTSWEDIEKGTNVLYETLVTLSR